jgi:serine/threonine-protein kinase
VAVAWFVQSTAVRQQADAPPPRIVVLPFENLGSPEDEYFADGITEEITSRLAAVSGLQVISRTSAMYYKDRQLPLRQIGEELDVEYALEGTIRWDRAGRGPGRVRITPQLIRVADDSHLWSNRYNRVLDEIFVVQSDISERVITELEVALFDHERKHVTALPTNNVEAYQAYLLGNQYLQSHEAGGWRDSIDMLESSVELDPEFAVAHAALSRAHSMTYHYRLDFTPERLEKAKASADRALALQPNLPEAHLALGWYFYFGFRDYDRALEEFERAAETLPNDAAVLEGLHATRRRQGRWDEALDALDQLLVLSPQAYHLALNAAYTYMMLRNYGRAEVEFRRALALEPDLAGPYHGLASLYLLWDDSTERAWQILELAPDQNRPLIQAYAFMLDRIDRDPESAMERVLGAGIDVIEVQSYYWPAELLECVCLSDLGREQPARAACESAISRLEREVALRSWDRRLYNALGYAYAVVGRNQDAVEAVEHAARLMPISEDAADGPEQAIETAIIFTRVGRYDRALDLVEELLSIPSFLSVGLLRLDPVWDPLRDHPRFQALLEDYGEE